MAPQKHIPHDVFRRILSFKVIDEPPVRVRPWGPRTRRDSRNRDYFLMDFENACLASDWCGAPPTGPNRYQNYQWACMIKANVFPHHSDVDWQEYCQWVAGGGGDEWFQEE